VSAGGCGGHDPGLFNVIAVHAAGADAQRLEAQLLAGLEENPALTQEQFARAQSRFAVAYSQLLKQPQMLAQLLTEAVAAGDWRLVFKMVNEVKALKLEDVQRVAKAYLNPNNRTLARYEPVAQSGAVMVPAVANRSAGLDQLTSQTISQGEQLDPSPLSLQQRTQFSVLPQSGIKLALLPKKSRGDEVVGEIHLNWGDLAELNRRPEADFVARLLAEGNTQLTRQQIIDEQVRLKGSLSISGRPQGVVLRLQGERAGFKDLLRLGIQVLRAPTFPQESFNRLQRDTIKSLSDSRAEPEVIRREATREYFNAQRQVQTGHPEYMASLDERIARTQSVTLDQVRAFHNQWWSANEGQAAFVGPLPEGLTAVLDTELAAWKKPGTAPFKRWAPPFRPVAAAAFHAQADDKASAVLRLYQSFKLHGEHPDAVALNVVNHLLGGGSLESRLNVRLRQQNSLTYGIGSGLQTSNDHDDSSWVIQTSMAPENRDKALAAIHDTLNTLLRDGISAAELERARKDLMEGRRQGRSTDAGIVSRLAALVERDLDWRYTESWDERYRNVTLDDVNRALRQYLRLDAWVISSAGDYVKKPPVKP
jgi:zinc protease